MKKNKKIFDLIIFKRALLTNLKSIWIWIFIVVSLGGLILIGSLMMVPIFGELIPYSLISIIWLIAIMCITLTDFTKNLINDRQYEVINMELRKGRSTRQILFSRILSNRIFVYGYSVIITAILLIIFSSTGSEMLVQIIATACIVHCFEFILLGLYLMFYAWGFNKIVSLVCNVYIIICVALSSNASIISMYLFRNDPNIQTLFSRRYIRKAIITDEILRQIDEENSFANYLTENINYLNYFLEFIIDEEDSGETDNFEEQDTDSPPLKNIILSQGVFMPEDVQNVLDYLTNGNSPYVFNETFKNSQLYKINDQIMSEPNQLSTDYSQSLYVPIDVMKSNARNFTLNEFDKTIELINKKYEVDYPQVIEFNNFLRVWAHSETTSLFNGIDYSLSPFTSISAHSISSVVLQVPVGLKLWNEMVIKMLYQASSTSSIVFSDNALLTKTRLYAAVMPFLMTWEMLSSPNQYVNKISPKFASNAWNLFENFNFSWYFKGNTWYNQNVTSETFGDVNPTRNENKKNYGITYSYIGYAFALTTIAITLVIISFYLFERNIRK